MLSVRLYIQVIYIDFFHRNFFLNQIAVACPSKEHKDYPGMEVMASQMGETRVVETHKRQRFSHQRYPNQTV